MFANVIDELEVFLLGPSSSVCVLLIAAGFPHCIVISAFEEIKLGMEKLVVLYNISEREREHRANSNCKKGSDWIESGGGNGRYIIFR